MKSLNKVQLIGRVGSELEIKYSGSGTAVVNLSIATSTRYKDREGTPVENTEWHRAVGFGKAAELMGDLFKKGSLIYIEGSLRTRKWQNKDGVDQYTTEIVVDEFIAMDKRPSDAGGNDEANEASGTNSAGDATPDKKPKVRRARAAA